MSEMLEDTYHFYIFKFRLEDDNLNSNEILIMKSLKRPLIAEFLIVLAQL